MDDEEVTFEVSTTAVVGNVTHTPEVYFGDVYLYVWLPLLLVALLIALVVYLTCVWKRRRKNRHQNDVCNMEPPSEAAADASKASYHINYNTESLYANL